MGACAFPQPDDEAENFGLHLLAQPGQALLRVIHELLDKECNEKGKRKNTMSSFVLGHIHFTSTATFKVEGVSCDKCFVPSHLVLSLLLFLLLELFLSHTVFPFHPVQLLIQGALVNMAEQKLNEKESRYS